MVSHKERVAVSRRNFKKITNLEYTPARLGNGRGLIKVKERSGYVYVRTQGADNRLNPIFPVLLPSNSSVKLDNGNNVKLGWDEHGRRIVLSADVDGDLAVGRNSVDTSSANGSNTGQSSITQGTIETLRVKALTTPVWAVNINAWLNIRNKIVYRMRGISNVDLTGEQPSVDEKCMIGIFLKDDYTARVTSSTPIPISDLSDVDGEIQECVDTSDETDNPIWFIPVNGNMLGIDQPTINSGFDARRLINDRDTIYYYTPSSSADSVGQEGDMAWDEDYLYIKTPINGWVRTATTTF